MIGMAVKARKPISQGLINAKPEIFSAHRLWAAVYRFMFIPVLFPIKNLSPQPGFPVASLIPA
jgi:hypothetical protein